MLNSPESKDICGAVDALASEEGKLTSLLDTKTLNDYIITGNSVNHPYPSYFATLPKCLNTLESCEETALSLALRHGLTIAVVTLLSHPDIDVTKPVNMNAWNYFSENHFDIPNVSFPLMYAVQDPTFTKLLLNHPRIDVNQKNVLRETALMRACEYGNVNVVKDLLNIPTLDVNCKNIHGESALWFAMEEPAVLELL
jgi:hypothetical protein